MSEHLWQEPNEQIDDPWAEQSVDAQPGVAASAPRHEALYASVWPESYPDLMAARDSHIDNMLKEEAAARARMKEENAVFRQQEEDERKKRLCDGLGPRAKSPDVPGPRICPACENRTWDLLTLGVCDKCGMRKVLKESLKKVKLTRVCDSDDDAPAQATAKARAKAKEKGASRKQKAEAKAAAKAAANATAQKAQHFYEDFVKHHAHGQAPLVSSWEPQQAAASSSWQPPMPPPPPASSSRTPPAPPAPPSRSSSSWQI